MALSNFTVLYDPFDGAKLTDTNTIFIDADTGDDNNPGTRDLPKKSLQSINVTGKKYLLRGVFNENYLITTGIGIILIGDLNTVINGSIIFRGSGAMGANLKIANIKAIELNNEVEGAGATPSFNIKNCEFGLLNTATTGRLVLQNTVAGSFMGYPVSSGKCTIKSALIYATGIDESIISENIKFWSSSSDATYLISISPLPVITNTVIFKSAQWKWINNTIPVTYTTPGNEIADIKAALLDYANNVLTVTQQKTYLTNVANNIFGYGTIIYDDSAPNVRVFNRYDSGGSVADASLNLENGNPALTASFTKSIVGKYRPKLNVTFKAPREITDTGAETGNAGTLLATVNESISIDMSSLQKRNKMETDVVSMYPGDMFTQWQSSFMPASTEFFYFGAKQILQTGQHPINAVLVTPYDTPATPSAFPKFLAPFNSPVEIAYNATTNAPILFNDLAALGIVTNKNLAECGTWAVSNACHEWYPLMQAANVRVDRPRFRHFVLTLIANNAS